MVVVDQISLAAGLAQRPSAVCNLTFLLLFMDILLALFGLDGFQDIDFTQAK